MHVDTTVVLGIEGPSTDPRFLTIVGLHVLVGRTARRQRCAAVVGASSVKAGPSDTVSARGGLHVKTAHGIGAGCRRYPEYRTKHERAASMTEHGYSSCGIAQAGNSSYSVGQAAR
jgi:hypothetical protein